MTTLFISHSSKDKAWAEEVHAALRDQHYEALFLDSHPDDGIPIGDKWEQTLWQSLRRSGGVIVLCTANWLASPWCVAEAMIARERGKRVFILTAADVSDDRQTKSAEDGEPARRLPDFLKDSQVISLAITSREQAHRQLWKRLASLDRQSFPLPDRPYPGLEPFQESDAAVFFGRDDKIKEVLEVLERRRGGNAKGFVLVLGASGCGKSSLVRAGVLPWLKRASDKENSNAKWLILQSVMAGRGTEGLATVLDIAFQKAGKPSDQPALRRRLSTSGKGDSAFQALGELAGALLAIHQIPDGLILIVLDQLEEVFTTAEDSQARAALRLLLDASADAGSPMVVLATMRSDFLDVFQRFEGAAQRYEKVTLDPMLRSRFSEVIEGPAERLGLDLDPGLAERMAADTAYNDALPLLAFTLEKLYDKCKAEGRLTLTAYGDLGGVSASIKQAAEKILEETGYTKNGKAVPDDDPRMRDLRRAFYSLAQVGEEGQFTRRIARWSRMPRSCEAILKRFVGQRLLISDTANGEPVLSVAHEALFRVWDTLNGWLREDRKALALRSQIEDAAAEWLAEKRSEMRRELVWPEARIVDAVRVIKDSGVSLTDVKDRPTVHAFLGPTDVKRLVSLTLLDAADDGAIGSGLYGDAWRLPLSHAVRASVGDRLALLGDRRKGVGLGEDGVPDIEWVAIDGGEVTIEIHADPDDPTSEVVDRLTRSVAPFWMARYPVTVVQFRAFLDACYRDGEWRLPPGFMVDLPPSYPPPKPRARYGNQPVDSVNWWDACAFCHWLAALLDTDVWLPTEAKWQQAATGGDPARTYPWGAEWDPEQEPWRANTWESELDRSTAVGMYPAGASPAGVLDMAGTVWEWCSNAFDDPDNTAAPAS